MASSTRRRVPAMPRVISPSPDTSDQTSIDGVYFAPKTRSSTRKSTSESTTQRATTIDEVEDPPSDDPDLQRARSRSREADERRSRRRMSGLTPSTLPHTSSSSKSASKRTSKAKTKTNGNTSPSQIPNGQDSTHLLPPTPSYWQRALSRSPSPLGLIPIHRKLRVFVHKHEVPRKLLHVSIGFLTLYLYARGSQTSAIHPVLLSLLIPIAATDLLRHNIPAVNTFYIRCLGAFMRESEAHDRYNGVIWYLLGAWSVLRFFPKDVGVMGVVLLSWCDTAASTFGRLYGRYTPQLRRGKSLAGTLAACATGVIAGGLFWGWWAPRFEALGIADNSGPNAFAFRGVLRLPGYVASRLGLTEQGASITGGWALGVMSLVAGIVASASEAVDIFGWDDNVTIPVLCGVGLWGFLKVFGDA